MTLQLVIVAAVLLASLAYAARRVYVAFRRASDRCYGCASCALHDQLMRQQALHSQGSKPKCFRPGNSHATVSGPNTPPIKH